MVEGESLIPRAVHGIKQGRQTVSWRGGAVTSSVSACQRTGWVRPGQRWEAVPYKVIVKQARMGPAGFGLRCQRRKRSTGRL